MENNRKLSFDEIFSKRPGLEELKKLDRMPIYGLIENIRSMHNVGSIFRSSDGARLNRLFLSGYTACPPRKEIDKTALGATDSVPWTFSRDPLPLISELKQKDIKIVAVEHTANSISYTEAEYTFPLCIVMGNEVDGVSEEIIKQADQAVDLPMLGLKQSLNVSVAYGIILYEILARYLKVADVQP